MASTTVSITVISFARFMAFSLPFQTCQHQVSERLQLFGLCPKPLPVWLFNSVLRKFSGRALGPQDHTLNVRCPVSETKQPSGLLGTILQMCSAAAQYDSRFWTDDGLTSPYRIREGLPTIHAEPFASCALLARSGGA